MTATIYSNIGFIAFFFLAIFFVWMSLGTQPWSSTHQSVLSGLLALVIFGHMGAFQLAQTGDDCLAFAWAMIGALIIIGPYIAYRFLITNPDTKSGERS